jgi:hypothetical protein
VLLGPLLRRLLRAGRVGLVGGAYNEPDTNLNGAELTARSVVYGLRVRLPA